MFFVLVNELIFGLRRVELMIIDSLKFILRVQLFALLRLRITTVEKPFIAEPRTAAVLDPLQMIAQRLLARDIQDVEVVPV